MNAHQKVVSPTILQCARFAQIYGLAVDLANPAGISEKYVAVPEPRWKEGDYNFITVMPGELDGQFVASLDANRQHQPAVLARSHRNSVYRPRPFAGHFVGGHVYRFEHVDPLASTDFRLCRPGREARPGWREALDLPNRAYACYAEAVHFASRATMG